MAKALGTISEQKTIEWRDGCNSLPLFSPVVETSVEWVRGEDELWEEDSTREPHMPALINPVFIISSLFVLVLT